MSVRLYVFERADGSRYVRQFDKFTDAEQHANDEGVTIIERRTNS